MEQRHLQVVAALALLEEAGEAAALRDCLAENLAGSYQEACAVLEGTDVASCLKAWRSQEDFSGVAEIHPAWLVERLQGESPRIIGVVLRHLPSKHVRYLLEHLPKRLTLELPKLIEAFYVPSELLEVIRRRVERGFVPMRISHEAEPFAFRHLYYLKIEDLEKLCFDLGLSELALSLAGSSDKILKIAVNRFQLAEAKTVLKRIKHYQGEPRWFFKDARYSVLELGESRMGERRFLEELGWMALAKAFEEETSACRALKQKMAPQAAYAFQRYLGGAIQGKDPAKVAKRQEWVLNHVERLSRESVIDPFWQECFAREAA